MSVGTIIFAVILLGQLVPSEFVETARLLASHIKTIEIVEDSGSFQFVGEIKRVEDLRLVDEMLSRSGGEILDRTSVSRDLIYRKIKEIQKKHPALVVHSDESFIVISRSKGGTRLKAELLQIYPRIRIQREKRQKSRATIFLEIALVEIKKSRLRQLGLRFGSPVDFESSIRIARLAEPSKLLELKNFNPIGGFLDAALDKGDAKIHLKQSLVTRNSQKAVFRVGGEINVRLVSENSSNIDTIDYGMNLVFTPKIISKENMNLDIRASFREPSGVMVDGLPGIDERKLSTSLDVQSGESLAIAGFVRSRSDNNRRALPGAGEIPVLGRLFASKGKQQNDSEAYIFITPRVLKKNWRPEFEISQ